MTPGLMSVPSTLGGATDPAATGSQGLGLQYLPGRGLSPPQPPALLELLTAQTLTEEAAVWLRSLDHLGADSGDGGGVGHRDHGGSAVAGAQG